MKENLFSRATRSALPKLGLMPVFCKLILLPLLCIPLSYGAFQLDQDVPAQAPQGVIYLGDHAFIYGEAHIANAIIVTSPSKENVTIAASRQKKKQQPQKQLAVEKARENKALKKLQLEINRRIKNSSYSDASRGGLIKLSKTNRTAEGTTANFIFHFGKAILGSNQNQVTFCDLSGQQKIFSSLSYIQSGKFIKSFLRGPPLLTAA